MNFVHTVRGRDFGPAGFAVREHGVEGSAEQVLVERVKYEPHTEPSVTLRCTGSTCGDTDQEYSWSDDVHPQLNRRKIRGLRSINDPDKTRVLGFKGFRVLRLSGTLSSLRLCLSLPSQCTIELVSRIECNQTDHVLWNACVTEYFMLKDRNRAECITVATFGHTHYDASYPSRRCVRCNGVRFSLCSARNIETNSGRSV